MRAVFVKFLSRGLAGFTVRELLNCSAFKHVPRELWARRQEYLRSRLNLVSFNKMRIFQCL